MEEKKRGNALVYNAFGRRSRYTLAPHPIAPSFI